VRTTAKKRKRNLRQKGKEVAVPESSSSRRQETPDDRRDVGLAAMLSDLFGKHGAHPDQFYKSFRTCNGCERIVCNETSRTIGHACLIDLAET